jgi:hypothetical protein
VAGLTGPIQAGVVLALRKRELLPSVYVGQDRGEGVVLEKFEK